MTGTTEFSVTKSIKPWLPRGMIVSTYFFALSRVWTCSRSGGMRKQTSVSMSCFLRISWISFTAASFESFASELPLRTQAFPDLKQSEKTSKVTFGRAS